MSVIKRIIILLFTLAAIAMPVLAAAEERDPPGTLAVQIFLGFCALIIVAQLVPLARQTLRRLSEKKSKIVETASAASKD